MSQQVLPGQTPEAVRVFTRALLRDLQALERVLARGLIESDVRRFGVEQEMFLVDRGWRPALVALEVLERLGGAPFTTELALFNLEVALEPQVLAGGCFGELERRLLDHIGQAREAAAHHGAEVVLAGILPTLERSDLTLDNMTPHPRYHALNDVLTRMRGGAYRLRIEGTDELQIEHDSVMLEACNASCQVHLQVSAEEFARVYNVAQAVLAPVLAAAANSPLLFGRRLWAETRIALFQQSIDTWAGHLHLREPWGRVRFGDEWLKRSVVELFQEDVARFRVLLATPIEEDSLRVLDQGGVPRLAALQLHNSTVYRWNRPCYGISDGRPHLRIECRALPAGPTVADEVANAAFWIGAVLGGARELGRLEERMSFDDAKANFLAAAKLGLRAAFRWLDGRRAEAPALILEDLLPLARRGLAAAGVDPVDADGWLDVVRERVERDRAGANWAVRSLAAMQDRGTRGERLAALTAASARLQREGRPCHLWEDARLCEAEGPENYERVEQYMCTDLFTVHEDELVDLVAFLMDHQRIRHVLVEDDEHRLVGLVSYRSILRLMARGGDAAAEDGPTTPVKRIMERDLVTIAPETETSRAIELMRRHQVSCLPVVKDGKLVGIVGERDFMPIAHELLEEATRRTNGDGGAAHG